MTPRMMRVIENAGRTCYKSEDKMECDNPKCVHGKIYGELSGEYRECVTCEGRTEKFVQGLITRGHESVLEHGSCTVRLVTDRGMTHEIVRHRLASYSQESTRYCNYNSKGGEITVIYPHALGEATLERQRWEVAMHDAEQAYLDLLDEGVKPEWARSVLPTCLKTEIVVTANMRQWRHMMALRLDDAAGKAHPQIKELFRLILEEFCDAGLGPLFTEFTGELPG